MPTTWRLQLSGWVGCSRPQKLESATARSNWGRSEESSLALRGGRRAFRSASSCMSVKRLTFQAQQVC